MWKTLFYDVRYNLFFINLLKNLKKEFIIIFFPIGTPSPHAPFTPAPQYQNHFPDMKAPRIPSFNHMEEDNEGLMIQMKI